ncbi:MAG: alkaline phosphatase family protein [Bryobacteraceae bacterium]
MNRRSILVLSVCALALAQPPAAAPAKKPKLVLAIVVDQFRADYLYRFGAEYNSGLKRLWTQGAVFTNAHHEHYPTVTAIGHSTFLTGATPSLSGIVGNEWYDRGTGKQVTSVSDGNTKLLGGEGAGSSPRRLLVSTVVDEMKMSGRTPVKAIGVSIKDRSAILPIGHMGDGAYWFDNKSGNMVSSTYYFSQMPEWAQAFNRKRMADQWVNAEWKPLLEPAAKPFVKMEAKLEEKYWAGMQRTPYGNELLEAFAEQAVIGEKLGQTPGATDVLALSLSSNDYVGHEVGPDSPRVRDISIRTDRLLGKLFQFLDAKVGMQNVLIAFTADHGVSPIPELMKERKMPGGRLVDDDVFGKVTARLVDRYGAGDWIQGRSGSAAYLNHGLIRGKRLNLAAIRREAAEVLRSQPHIFRVYTQDQMVEGLTIDDAVDRRVRNGYYAGRSADLLVIPEPYYIFDKTGTTHGTPFNYDSHVPVILAGPGIKPGKYHRRVMVNDIAPTLATLLEVETPSGAMGRVLDEALR